MLLRVERIVLASRNYKNALLTSRRERERGESELIHSFIHNQEKRPRAT